MVCAEHVSLLFKWSAMSQEYARTVMARSKATTPRERVYLNAAVADVRSQSDAARVKAKEHQRDHGC